MFTRNAFLTTLACVLLATAGASGQIYKELVLSTNRTLAIVSPTNGQVSQNFTAWLVNSGQQTENIEIGVSDSGSGTTFVLPTVPNPVGPGQTATVTISVGGTGGRFPYWIDFWGQIEGATDTRKTVTLTVDTTAATVTPRRTALRPVQQLELVRSANGFVLDGPATMYSVDVFTLVGRASAPRNTNVIRLPAACNVTISRVRSSDGASCAFTVAPLR